MELNAFKLDALYRATDGKGLEGTVIIEVSPGDQEGNLTLIDRLKVEGFTVAYRVVNLDSALITVLF